MRRRPDFLLIGAMKSGSTTLFFDLASNPAVYLAPDKEASLLTHDRVLEEPGLTEYERPFRGAAAGQVCGEASTAYSKLPDVPGVPRRARRVCGADLKILYLVREPVARIISHHYHDLARGEMPSDVDRAVRERSCLLDYSRYAMQLGPWLETFGRERIKVLRFETFVADRRGTAVELARFLGVEPRPELVRDERIYNPSQGKRAPRGRLWALSRGAAYQRWLRPLLPRAVRTSLARRLLPDAPSKPAPPAVATVDWILERLADDQAELQQILELERPVWDLAEVRARFAADAARKRDAV